MRLIICLGINGCAPAPAVIEPVNEDSSFDNPLLAPFDTPFGIPSQVTEADGSHLGIIYLDLHSRPGKENVASPKAIHNILLLTEELILLYQPPFTIALDYEEKQGILRISLTSDRQRLISPLDAGSGADQISKAIIAGLAEQFLVEELSEGSVGTRLSMIVKNTS